MGVVIQTLGAFREGDGRDGGGGGSGRRRGFLDAPSTGATSEVAAEMANMSVRRGEAFAREGHCGARARPSGKCRKMGRPRSG